MASADTKIAYIEAITGYIFTNKLLCAEALHMDRGPNDTPGPVHIAGTTHFLDTNTRLAVVGDAMMDAVLSAKWFSARSAGGQPLRKEEFDKELRQTLLTNKGLGERGRPLGVGAAIIMNAGCGSASNKMIATTIEGVVGAAFLDAGASDLSVVRNIMARLGLFDHSLLAVPELGTSQAP